MKFSTLETMFTKVYPLDPQGFAYLNSLAFIYDFTGVENIHNFSTLPTSCFGRRCKAEYHMEQEAQAGLQIHNSRNLVPKSMQGKPPRCKALKWWWINAIRQSWKTALQ